jgi:hypothetical protein
MAFQRDTVQEAGGRVFFLIGVFPAEAFDKCNA